MRTKAKFLVVTVVVGVGLFIGSTVAVAAIFGLTVDKTAPLTLNRTSATVSGTIQCSPTAFPAFIDVQLVQGKGSTVVIGDAEGTEVVCDGTVQSWSVIVSLPQGATFKPGKVTARVFAEDDDNEREIQTTIRLTTG